MSSVGNPPAILNEGLAVYMSARLGAPPLKNLGGGDLSVYEKVRRARRNGQWIPLKELLTYTEIGSRRSRSRVSYPQAGAFVRFLIDTHGKDKLLRAYRQLSRSSDSKVRAANERKLAAIYGQSVEQLEKAWLAAMTADGEGK